MSSFRHQAAAIAGTRSTASTPLRPGGARLVVAGQAINSGADTTVAAGQGARPLRRGGNQLRRDAIAHAPAGEQERTLNAECSSIGTLAGAAAVPADLALSAPLRAGAAMPSHDPRHSWRPEEIDFKVRRAFCGRADTPAGGAPCRRIGLTKRKPRPPASCSTNTKPRHAAGQGNGTAEWREPIPDYVRERLSLSSWLNRELPPLDPPLGELATTTSRIMLVGPTGLGKTSISMALGIAIADGRDFLHWRGGGRPRRVIYVDGEMSRRLFKARIRDAVRRHGSQPVTFFAFSREDFEDMPPLGTPEGQKYMDLVTEAIGGADILFLDNIQALTIGDLREPESWRKVIPWTRDLTRRRIGQIWEHHTGLAEDHGYGDKSREWQLDTVALMETIERPEADIAFSLKFTKARERTPDNRADFEAAVIYFGE
jgi:AAA domain